MTAKKATGRKAPAKRTTKRVAKPAAVVEIPTGLPTFAAKGQQLWDDITGRYDLRLDEQRALEDACREVDLIERIQDELDAASLIVHGSMGQPVASPLVQEIRQHRAVLDRLLKSLKLPEVDEGETAGDRSSSARERALKRWGSGS